MSSPTRATRHLLWIAPLLAAGLWWFQHREIPWALFTGDEYEYADLGRQLARGDGFTTGIIYPVEVDYGVERGHPALLRPPLWPLSMAAAFALTGPQEWAVHWVLMVFFAAMVGTAAALAGARGGVLAGAIAGVAVATSPQISALAYFGGTETLFGLLSLAPFALLACGARPFWIGLVCGLAYLTRYNGVVLLPVVGLVLFFAPGRVRALGELVAGFAVVALPWWIRNFAITGNPLFSLYNYAAYFSPFERSYTTTLLHSIEPNLSGPTAMNPLEKARLLLPDLIRGWPLASANLAACVGVVLGCVRRDRLFAAFAILAVGTTVGLAMALPRGRYFVPMFPTLLALGTLGWWQYGGKLRAPGLALLLAAPLLPSFPAEARDVSFFRAMLKAGPEAAPPTPVWVPCVDVDQLIMAEDAPTAGWKTDALTLWLPATEADFWTLVDAHPVEKVQIRTRKELLTDRFRAEFEAVPGCGAELFQRKGAAGRQP